MTFFDYWKAFHSILEKNALPATAQLVGYKLLAEFNGAKFPAEVSLTDRELQRQTNIKSLDSIHNAKALLKSVGFIDFNNRKNKPTVYRLIQPNNQTNTSRTPNEHETNTETASLKRAREDVLDSKNVKTNYINNDSAGARESVERYLASSRTIAQAWQMANGEYPHGYDDRRLLELEARYGAEKLKEAIETAAASNTAARISINYVRAILERSGANVGDNADSGGSQRDSQYYGGDDVCES